MLHVEGIAEAVALSGIELLTRMSGRQNSLHDCILPSGGKFWTIITIQGHPWAGKVISRSSIRLVGAQLFIREYRLGQPSQDDVVDGVWLLQMGKMPSSHHVEALSLSSNVAGDALDPCWPTCVLLAIDKQSRLLDGLIQRHILCPGISGQGVLGPCSTHEMVKN